MQDTIHRVQKSFDPFQKIQSYYRSDTVENQIAVQDSGIGNDPVNESPFLREEIATVNSRPHGIYTSRNITSERPDDWHLILVLGVLISIAWLRVVYAKYIYSLFISSYNYQAASKAYSEKTNIQKRIWFIFDLIYFINGSLFLLEIYKHYDWDFLGKGDFRIFVIFFAVLIAFFLTRVFIMSIIGHLFDRYALFKSFLYHYYIFTRVIGVILIPYIILLPYTFGYIHNVLVYSSLLLIAAIYLLRMIRIAVFIRKNVLLLFYLFLYLCAVELLPILVIIKLILSLT